MKRSWILLNKEGEDGNGQGQTPSPQTISISEHQKALEKARSEEKNKLHADLSAAEQLAQEAQKKVEQIAQEKAELASRLDALQKSAKDGGGFDPGKLIEEVTLKARAEVETKLGQQLAEATQRVSALEKAKQAMELEQIKREAIAAAGGESRLIMALVGGNTPEAIRESVSRAAEMYQQIERDALARHGKGAGNGQPTSAGSPPSIGTPAAQGGAGKAPAPAVVALQSVKSMSLKEFAANQREIMAQVKAVLGQNGQSAPRS